MADGGGTLTVETRSGDGLTPVLPALARLRVEVFRDWPYLYDGSVAYEERYLQTYVRSRHAAIVIAFDGDEVIGASTCLPMADETENVRAPFLARGWDVARFFYFGESVLRRSYRGRGLGVAFFEGRERHARAVSDAAFSTFCGVVRDDDDPRRPAGFTPLDAFWTRRGYTRRADLACAMAWRELGDADETAHRLVFWMKSLHGEALP